jgi:hypothetical protein
VFWCCECVRQLGSGTGSNSTTSRQVRPRTFPLLVCFCHYLCTSLYCSCNNKQYQTICAVAGYTGGPFTNSGPHSCDATLAHREAAPPPCHCSRDATCSTTLCNCFSRLLLTSLPSVDSFPLSLRAVAGYPEGPYTNGGTLPPTGKQRPHPRTTVKTHAQPYASASV